MGPDETRGYVLCTMVVWEAVLRVVYEVQTFRGVRVNRLGNRISVEFNKECNILRTLLEGFAEEAIHARTQTQLLRRLLTVRTESNNCTSCSAVETNQIFVTGLTG